MSSEYTNETLSRWVEDCLYSASKPLTKWEQNFCESVSEQLEAGKRLTERQVEILERIYAEKTD